ncbi:MAG: succinate dehydrogenase, cytochrome b556 subunit [Rhodobacteraceae bacterium]|nr:succinate dehydrogenase, cytochrome b556 subunit [Paracoccaceae bacterium]
MADINQSDRPLSPHLSVYRMPMNATMSILHRATGVAMAASGLLIIWWFLAAAISPSYFNFVNGLATSWVGDIVLTLSLFSLWYHFTNGIRHLIWDTGSNLGMRRVQRSGVTGIAVTIILTALTIYIA